jgi:hypothetical protein
MAGNINSNHVTWVVGETYGVDQSGAQVTLATALPPATSAYQAYGSFGAGTAVPTGAPTGAPFYLVTPANDLYTWEGTAWFGPYGTHT